MATDTDIARTVERSRAVFTNLLKQLPATDRDLHLVRLGTFYQERIDDVLSAIDALPPPTSVRSSKRQRASRPAPEPSAGALANPDSPPHVHDATCEHVHKAVERADSSTVPGAVRAVLATERGGLYPRQIIEGVRILRPDTDEPSVHGALHAMRKRGEIAREGFHKNYRYMLTPVSSLGTGIVRVANGNDSGGATH